MALWEAPEFFKKIEVFVFGLPSELKV